VVIVAAALIAATAALMTAAVAFSGFLITKDLKTTEFRQAWINDQRADLSILIAEARTIARFPSDQQLAASLRTFDEAATRVSLRENPTKEEWKQPLALIADLRSALATGAATPASVERLVSDLTSDAQILLKTEWDRVRAGEETYQKARRIVIWVGACAALLILGLLWAIGYGKGFIVIC
jgi:CHASE3 domain sensor protein